MADNASTAATAATAASSAVSSVTTRSQQQKNEEKAAAVATQATAEGDDGTPTPASDHNRKKACEPFKGKSDKMSGHVFQLAAEGRKANQFLETMKAFCDYANVELNNTQDLAPWFNNPCTHVVLVELPDECRQGNNGFLEPSKVHTVERPMRAV
jgi:beta-mannanase